MTQPTAKPTSLELFNSKAQSYEKYSGGCTWEVAGTVIGLLPPVTQSSVILDNAAGTGAATALLLKRIAPQGITPEIQCVDGAPNMIEICRERFAAVPNVETRVSPGEDLSAFPDGKFSHAVTVMGLFFFTDAPKGVREVYRTLAPGGVAIFTGWSDLGHPQIIRKIQKTIRPQDPVMNLPYDEVWSDLNHMKKVLADAGFAENIETIEVPAHWAAKDKKEIVDEFVVQRLDAATVGWSDEEKARARSMLEEEVDPASEEFTQADGSKALGIKMRAYIHICKKK